MALFEDRVEAAKQLARKVQQWLDNKNKITAIEIKEGQEKEQQKPNNKDDTIVLAIPRGGVIVGDVIVSMLGAKLDIIVTRKIGAPDNPELAIGAVMPDGSYFLNEDIVNMLNVPKSYITEQANVQKKEIERRLQSFRGENSDYYYDYNNFEGKTVVLVDDGVATAPPSPPISLESSSNEDIVSKLNQIADKVMVLYRPDPFYSVGQFYKHFEQVDDAEVREIMKRHGHRPL